MPFSATSNVGLHCLLKPVCLTVVGKSVFYGRIEKEIERWSEILISLLY